MEEQLTNFQSLLKSKQSEEAIKLLEAFPELIDAQTEHGVSLLLLAAYHKNQVVVDFLLKHKNNFSIFESAATGNLNQVVELIQSDPELINQFSSDGFTPLGLASYFNHKETVIYLIENGADVNLASENGMKVAPLHSAVANRNLLIAKILLDNGADVNARQTLGVTPLHSAAHQGDSQMVKLLVRYKADLKAEMENGKRPLDIAQKNHHEVIALLTV